MSSDSKYWLSFIGATDAGISNGRTEADFLEAQLTLATPRKLMKKLRDITLEKASPQKKLSEIVKLIAQELRTDVCSCFILRPGDLLELFSAQGLSDDV